jgi:hypothetical protein
MKLYWENGYIAPHIRIPGSRRMRVLIIAPCRTTINSHGPKGDMDERGRKKSLAICQKSNLGSWMLNHLHYVV